MSSKQKKLFSIFFWIVSLTWGCLLTIPGLIIVGICILAGCKYHKNGCSIIVEVGGNWGGLEIGAVALCGRYSQKDGPCYDPNWFEHTRKHEFGHNIQELMFGPFQIFLGLASALRYWYRRLTPKKQHKPYDAFWVEGMATNLGYKWMERFENTIENK